MSTESFLQALELPVNSDIEPVERRFMEEVKQRIQAVAASFDEAEVAQEEAWLRSAFGDFYAFSLEWAQRELRSNEKGKDHHEAARLKKDAKTVIADLQRHIIEFAICYMHINRFMTLLRDEIKAEEMRGRRVGNVRWTADVGQAIAKYRGQKKKLTDWLRHLDTIRPLVQQIEGALSDIESGLKNLFGADTGAKLLRGFVAAYRSHDTTRAQRALSETKQQKKKFTVDQKSYEAGLSQIERQAAAVRAYESEVVGHISYLLGGPFAEVPNIHKQALQIVAEFRAGQDDMGAIAAALAAEGGADEATQP